ncbi:hypothetical protein Q8G48_28480, partial [Klebsiella pneumoniae]|uniref:hypothetical protein n=1 Tax=Klebsiella pneumoniae TaxID=573 RepID=UPI0030140B2C
WSGKSNRPKLGCFSEQEISDTRVEQLKGRESGLIMLHLYVDREMNGRHPLKNTDTSHIKPH